jgi:hypothetical protein
MMRVLLMAVAFCLVGEVSPASAYTCTEWCNIHRCNGGVQTGSVPVRVCMNRCVASCRLLISKRKSNAS